MLKEKCWEREYETMTYILNIAVCCAYLCLVTLIYHYSMKSYRKKVEQLLRDKNNTINLLHSRLNSAKFEALRLAKDKKAFIRKVHILNEQDSRGLHTVKTELSASFARQNELNGLLNQGKVKK